MKRILTYILVALTAFMPTATFAQTTGVQGGTGWGTSVTGDLLVGTSTTPFLRYYRLPIGTTGFVLQSNGTIPNWVSTTTLGISGGSGTNFWTNSGITTTLNTGSVAAAGSFNATSTTATSTFSGNVTIGTSGGVYANGTSNKVNFAGGTGGSGSFGGPIVSNGTNSFAWGNAEGSAASITSSGRGSIALGSDSLLSSGEGSIAVGFGKINTGGSIISTANGSFAGGYSVNDSVIASGDGSFAYGDIISATQFLSTAFGSGYSNTTANTFQVGYSSLPTLTVNATRLGVGTTTPGSLLSVGTTNGINFSTATSTFNSTGGININSGCYAILGSCITGGGTNFWTASGVTTTLNTGSIAAAGSFSATSTTATSTFAGDVTIGAGTVSFVCDYTGFCGVGTSTPTSVLSVSKPATSTTPYFTVASTTNSASQSIFQIDQNGHMVTGGPSPTVSGGTSSVVGNDNNGIITVTGTLLTSVTLTFAKSWTNAPDCTIGDGSTGITAGITTSTTQMVVSFSAGVNSGTVMYVCRGH